MPILTGSLSARVWRVTDPLPAQFAEDFEKSLRRHAFRPIDTDKGHARSFGWVNIRQVLDSNLSMKKALFRNIIALALRVDRIAINQRLFRATLAQETAKVLREQKVERISREQRQAIEEQVRNKLFKEQPPSMSIYEWSWHLETGLVFFGATGDKLNQEFADLFTQTFSLGIEPQFPYFRAQRWARRQKVERELMELLPAPFSPSAPAEVIEVISRGEED